GAGLGCAGACRPTASRETRHTKRSRTITGFVRMGESMTRPIPAALHHTCFLVRDLEGAAQRLADALGIGPWNIWTITPSECLGRGEVSLFPFRVALTTVGGGTYELITPRSGRSVFDEHLEEHAEGFHHTCLVYPSLKAVREAKVELRRQRGEPIQGGS